MAQGCMCGRNKNMKGRDVGGVSLWIRQESKWVVWRPLLFLVVCVALRGGWDSKIGQLNKVISCCANLFIRPPHKRSFVPSLWGSCKLGRFFAGHVIFVFYCRFPKRLPFILADPFRLHYTNTVHVRNHILLGWGKKADLANWRCKIYVDIRIGVSSKHRVGSTGAINSGPHTKHCPAVHQVCSWPLVRNELLARPQTAITPRRQLVPDAAWNSHRICHLSQQLCTYICIIPSF